MARKEKLYSKLSGGSFTLFSRYSLWLGPDHLLSVRTFGYAEYYRRFYYKDIQAVTATKTARGKITNAILGLPVVFSLAAAYATDGDFTVVFLMLAGFCALFLGLNVLLGPTCVCRVYTAVQTAFLPSLYRMRKAAKAMDRLRPLIENVQGPLDAGAFPGDDAFKITQVPQAAMPDE